MSSLNRFKNLSEKPQDDDQKRCWICNKSEADIRADFMKYMSQPENADNDIKWEDLVVISYKTKQPICAGCFFHMKKNKDLLEEMFKRPEEDIWGKNSEETP
jgi:hypothetical protein